ncbi:HlyD family efflux transporter periplasmic adaptor subunit [Paenibacillus sp. 19GGS1-52]|uniref:HlyD family efflux transporter periplasmic adaptor subunit n=1 Tax=Paenibacillus sp. 19GGS1-52 TaxID=2758563 RepID=UPI001EFAB5FA|nr:HlyD family efflux transporter periplasmic adaptor subunit [Paenibacillus sp. 19GGS1-52]ULO08012.1 HlyD family efflux transporter periplasmic adaptor subunit [Paenibacillus sp. 19GGS1-52]
MNGMIRDLSEMSDSREIMESKTNPVISVFILIVFILLAAAFTWSFYGQMDVVAKASAVVRPNEKVSTIQSSLIGKVEDVYIHEGMQVQRGAKLISFEHKDLDIELLNQQSELNKLTRKLQYLQQYKQSINDLNNLFSPHQANEAYYYDMVEQFLLEYQQQQQIYETTKNQLASAIQENTGSQETILGNLHSSENKSLQDKNDLERKKKILVTELTNEKQLAQSINENRNLLPPFDTKRTEQYKTYQIKYVQLTKLSAEKKAIYDRSLSLGERLVSKSQIEEDQQQYNSALLQTSQYQHEALLSTASNITDYSSQLEELQASLTFLTEGKDPSVSEREALKLQQKQLSEKQTDLLQQKELGTTSEETTLEKLKLDRIVQIHSVIEDEQKNLNILLENVKQLEVEKEKKILVAPITGTVNILKETNAGDIVQPGESLMAIIPTNESKYKMSIAVPNSEAGKISLGNQVDLNFAAFPKQSFGSLRGTITSISTDSMVQQNGLSYYLVEATIPNTPLENRRGERGELRVGMTANASIITDSKKIIDFILEKINLKE